MKYTMIKGMKYKINVVPSLPDDDLGSMDPKKKVIEISLLAEEDVLIHEELHALFYECGIRDMETQFEHVIIEIVTDYILEKFKRKE